MLCDFAWAGRPGAAGAQIMKDTWCVDVIFLRLAMALPTNVFDPRSLPVSAYMPLVSIFWRKPRHKNG